MESWKPWIICCICVRWLYQLKFHGILNLSQPIDWCLNWSRSWRGIGSVALRIVVPPNLLSSGRSGQSFIWVIMRIKFYCSVKSKWARTVAPVEFHGLLKSPVIPNSFLGGDDQAAARERGPTLSFSSRATKNGLFDKSMWNDNRARGTHDQFR
jgi:hypothetical protein